MKKKNESGEVIVEATLIFPVVILSILALLFAALFTAQKANLQANLQNALVYFKNSESDTFVTTLEGVAYNRGDGKYGAVGNQYDVPPEGTVNGNQMFPYRFLWMQFNSNKFKQYFLKSCGNMFFYDGKNVEVSVKSTNWVIYKKITASATQKMKIPFNTKMIGIDPEFDITVSAAVVVSDGDNFVRTTDMVVYLYNSTKFSKKVNEIIEKGVSFYEKFKEILGV